MNLISYSIDENEYISSSNWTGASSSSNSMNGFTVSSGGAELNNGFVPRKIKELIEKKNFKIGDVVTGADYAEDQGITYGKRQVGDNYLFGTVVKESTPGYIYVQIDPECGLCKFDSFYSDRILRLRIKNLVPFSFNPDPNRFE